MVLDSFNSSLPEGAKRDRAIETAQYQHGKAKLKHQICHGCYSNSIGPTIKGTLFDSNIPDLTHIDKFTINKYNQLQMSKEGEEPVAP